MPILNYLKITRAFPDTGRGHIYRCHNFEDLNNNEALDYIPTIDNDAWILDFDVDLGLLESNVIYSDTNQVADDAYIYNFQVAESKTLYSEINLGNFQDDLDLELWEWNNISNNWELLASSESPENQDESIFKVIGPGQYSIGIKNYADLDDNNAPSGYDLEIDNQSWLSTVAIPDDPLFTNQWHLFNTGQGTGSDNIDIYAPEAWGLRSTSPSTTVAIIDGGVDLNHEDLINNHGSIRTRLPTTILMTTTMDTLTTFMARFLTMHREDCRQPWNPCRRNMEQKGTMGSAFVGDVGRQFDVSGCVRQRKHSQLYEYMASNLLRSRSRC